MTKPLWTSSEITAATKGACPGKWQVTGVSIDSRTVKKGDLFIALKGPNFDAHDFVSEALSKGASGALVSHIPPRTPMEKLVLAGDTFIALQDLGRAGRARSTAKIIAVTGSVGKTGSKEALRQVLSAQAQSFATQGSYNNHWGAPLSLAQLPKDTAFGVFELGMNHPGELEPLSKLTRPHVALITAIAAAHLGYFKNLQEIARAKAEIFEGLEPGGYAVLPGDDAQFTTLKTCAEKTGIKNIARFGSSKDCEARIEEVAIETEKSRVKATVLGKTLQYTLPVPGEHWISNSLGVLLSVGLAGADLERAAETLGALKLPGGRGGSQLVGFPKGSFILTDESYNASPAAVEAALKVLGRRKPHSGGKRVLVLGDMKELGEESQKLHIDLAPSILSADIGKVFGCGEMTRYLIGSLPKERQGGWTLTSAELAPLVVKQVHNGDVITVKGSHSMEMEKIVQALLALQTSSVKQSAG